MPTIEDRLNNLNTAAKRLAQLEGIAISPVPKPRGELRLGLTLYPVTSEVYLSLNFVFLLQGKQAGYRAGLFLLIFCFCLFACGKRTAHLKWEDTSDNEDGFRIYRITAKNTTKIAEVGANVTTSVDKDALAGVCYAVSAYNSAGESSPSNTSCLPD